MNSAPLSGKFTIVTGASSPGGIGREAAQIDLGSTDGPAEMIATAERYGVFDPRFVIPARQD